MARPAAGVISGAKAASARMADRKTAFIYNEWYVAAYADELGRELVRRTLLDKPLVLYRTTSGTPIALEDRCAHRSFPLSAGSLDGDTLVCGYHGFRYDEAGNVIEVPSQSRCPRRIGVKKYALREVGPLVWIWMGDEAAADDTKLPPAAFLTSPDWVYSKGYFHLNGSYVSLHENLLDLTHLSYLHAKSFGSPDYAKAPYDVTIQDGYFCLLRRVVPTTLPPVWAKPTNLEGYPKAARIAKSEFLSPGLHVVTATFYDSALPEGARPEYQISTLHIPTPETHGSTHYFIVNGRNFAIDQDWVTEFMHEQLWVAFQEDVTGLEALQRTLERVEDEDFFEVSVASDRPSVEMRKYLKQRADAEHAWRLDTTALHPAVS